MLIGCLTENRWGRFLCLPAEPILYFGIMLHKQAISNWKNLPIFTITDIHVLIVARSILWLTVRFSPTIEIFLSSISSLLYTLCCFFFFLSDDYSKKLYIFWKIDMHKVILFDETLYTCSIYLLHFCIGKHQWHLCTICRQIFLQGIPRNALPEDVERFLAGTSYDPNFQIFSRWVSCFQFPLVV